MHWLFLLWKSSTELLCSDAYKFEKYAMIVGCLCRDCLGQLYLMRPMTLHGRLLLLLMSIEQCVLCSGRTAVKHDNCRWPWWWWLNTNGRPWHLCYLLLYCSHWWFISHKMCFAGRLPVFCEDYHVCWSNFMLQRRKGSCLEFVIIQEFVSTT